MTWAKKYRWSFPGPRRGPQQELYARHALHRCDHVRRTITSGSDDFVTYNFAFFDAIPDWRYDPMPDQVYIDVNAGRLVRTVILHRQRP